MIVECPHCRTRVWPKRDGTCPSCQNSIHAPNQTSAAEAVLPADDPGQTQTSMEQPPRHYLMLLIEDEQFTQRIHPEAFGSFFTACQRRVERVLGEQPAQRARDILVACAVFPDGRKVCEIQSVPELSADIDRAIRAAILSLESPPVEEGPVPFAFGMAIAGGIDQPPRFRYPFSRQFTDREGSLDALLMEDAGLPFEPRSSESPSPPSNSGSLWHRLRKRLLGTRRSTPHSESVESDEQPATTAQQRADLLAKQPDSAAQYEARGQVHCSSGNYEQGIADFTQALQLDPQNIDVLLSRAVAYCYAGSTSRALLDYSEALSIEPLSHAARCGRASIYFELGAWDAAVADLTAALEADPRSPNLYVLRAKSHWRAGNLEAAAEDLNRAVDRDPHHAEARALRGFVRCARNRGDDDIELALQDLTRAIELSPDVASSYAHRGQVHLIQQDFQQAIDDCDRAIELDQHCGIAYAIRGLARQELGEMEESIEDCSKAIELDVSASEVYIGRALAHADQGDADTALVDIEAILSEEPTNIDALSLRGNLQIQLGDIETGIRDFESLVEMHPAKPRCLRSAGKRVPRDG